MATDSNSTAASQVKWEAIDSDLDKLISDSYQLRGMVLILVEHIDNLFFPALHRHPTSENYFYLSPRDREILGFAANGAAERVDVLDARLDALNEGWHKFRQSVL